MVRLVRLGFWGLLLATAACAPDPGVSRVAGATSAPPVEPTPTPPQVRVTTIPGSAAPTAGPTPAPEAPEEAISLEHGPTASPAPPVEVAEVQETTWLAGLQTDFAFVGPGQLELNREAEAPITRALGFNVPEAHDPEGFLWNEGDRGVEEWMPQGIGGFERDGRRWLVVSWYAKDLKAETKVPAEALSYRGARLSLIDVTDPQAIRYRHVLLVQDAANLKAKGLFRMGATARAGYRQGERFAPVPIHAGGVEVFGSRVYVVDTQLGIRVFDLDRMLRAAADPDKATCGVVDGQAVAFDYRYVMPEIAHYRITGAAPYSCLSLDRHAMTLWLGQYLAPDAAARSAVTGLPLGADGRVGDRATSMTFPKDKDGGYAHRIQGVFRQGRQTWMSITGQSRYEGSTARLALYEDGDATGYRWRWPHGAEDLYYDETRDRLWCLTEFTDSRLAGRDRCVFGVRLGSYKTP